MRREEDEAIVLDVEAAGEADRRVALLSGRGELVRGLAPAGARSRRRFGAALQPGARIRVRWTVRAEGAPAVFEEAQLLMAPPTPDPLDRYYTMLHVVETTTAFAREGSEDPRLFRLVSKVLTRLAAGDAIEPLSRYFEAWALRLAGLLPEMDACSACRAALAGRPVRVAGERGAFCSDHAPPGARRLSPPAVLWLEETRRRGPDDLPQFGPSQGEELARLLPALIAEFTERPLRALGALRRLAHGRNPSGAE